MENDKVKLAQLFEIAKGHGIVHNKGEFASLIGVDNSSLSHALKGDGKIKVENVVTKAEHALMKLGVALDNNAQGDNSMQNVSGSNNQIGVPPKNFSHEQEWFGLVAEKDKQIDRLLGIIENMQK